ncbi:MAG TPA: c-type cytochrome [Terriglobales bacterium]|nr:c-type cytochrome [Terriglobales bacterium]
MKPAWTAAALFFVLFGVCYAQPSGVEKTRGKQIFATNCSGCHGLDGTGSQRAPNIVSNPQVQKLSADELRRIISHGVPGAGMPAFHQLGVPTISSVVSYLRALQGNSRATRLPGDPKHGEQIFFGSGQCSTCHMAAGKGGFIGPDLTSYAQTHTVEKVKQAINDPAQRDSIKKVEIAVTREGEYRGVVVNEDNFSLQLQSLDGAFHFFSKSDLKAINAEQGSIMPSDYASKLSDAQLNDLVSYLLTVSKDAPVAESRPKEEE